MRGEGTLIEGVSLNLSLRHEVARVIVWQVIQTRMESKDGVRAASQQWMSAQHSPHRTRSFYHIRWSNSGCSSHVRAYFFPSVLRYSQPVLALHTSTPLPLAWTVCRMIACTPMGLSF